MGPEQGSEAMSGSLAGNVGEGSEVGRQAQSAQRVGAEAAPDLILLLSSCR